MSTQIENLVAKATFDNRQFEKNAAQTMQTLDKFHQKLNFENAGKGLEEIGKAASKVSFQPMANDVEKVGIKFDALAVVAVSALNRITNTAITTGKNLVKSLTLDPVMTGFSEYETKLNSIQTILSNTASKGKTMEDVTKVIDELNTYADKTIYNFAQMTRNIGTFTAAGVDLGVSVKAIQGIANLAAASGSNAQQASTAMYQLSQALASGTVRLMDWNSVVNAGMGGEKFQSALKETAREYGVAIDDIIKKQGSFRESLSEGWLSADIMTATLNKFTVKGAKEYAEAMMESGKYTREQADALVKEAQAMEDAATKVKTLTQLLDTLKEAAQSGWGKSWEIIVGDFEESRKLFTSVSDTIGGLIDSAADARNIMLQGWKDLGGRTALIKAIAKGFEIISNVIGSLKQGFEEIFPPATAQTLFDMSLAIKEFVYSLQPSSEALYTLKVLFKALLLPAQVFVQALRIGITVVTGFIKVAFKLVDSLLALPHLLGTIRDPFRKIFGDKRYTRITKALSTIVSGLGDAFGDLGSKLSSLGSGALESIINAFSSLGDLLSQFGGWILDRLIEGLEELAKLDFRSFGKNATKAIDWVVDGVKSLIEAFKKGKDGVKQFFSQFDLSSPIEVVKGIWAYISKFVEQFKSFDSAFDFTKALGPAGEALDGFKDVILKVAEAVQTFVKDLDPSKIIIFTFGVAVIALVASITRAVTAFAKATESVSRSVVGVLDASKGVMTSLNKILTGVVNKMNAAKITQFASAIVLLTIALIALAKTDSDKLLEAAGALAILMGTFTAMMLGMAAINKFLVKSPEMAKSLEMFSVAALAMSGSVVILSTALLILDKVNLEGIGGKLLALGAVLAASVVAVRFIGNSAADALSKAAVILAFAGAMALIAFTLSQISKRNLDISVSTVMSLIVVCVALKLLSNSIGRVRFRNATGMVLIVLSLGIFARQLEKLSLYDTGDLLAGLLNFIPIFVALAAIRLIMSSKDVKSLGTQFMGIAVGLVILYEAVKKFDQLTLKQILKGGACVSALILVFGAMQMLANIGNKGEGGKMKGAFITMSIAILILSLAIKYLGSMDLKTVIQGSVVVGALLGLMALLATTLAPAKKSAGTVLAIIAALGLMVTAIMLLSLIKDWKSLAMAVAALSATMLAFGVTLKLISGLKVGEAVGAILLIISMMTSITIALKQLETFDPEKSIAVATALSEVMLALAGFTRIFKTLEGGKGTGANWGTTALALLSVLVVCGVMLKMLDLMNIGPDILEKASALSVLMLAFSGVAAIMSKVKFGITGEKGGLKGGAADSAGGLVLFIGILTLFVTALGALFTNPKVAEVLQTGISTINSLYQIVPAIAVIGLIAGVFSKFKIDIASTTEAAASIIAFMLLITVLVEAIGGVFSAFPDLEIFLDKAVTVFPKIGQAIGGFIGGFGAAVVGGAAMVIMETITSLGESLSEFMANIGPFFKGLDEVDSDKVSAVASLGTMILSITAADLLASIKNFIGMDPLTKFGEQLVLFGPRFAQFASSISGINETKVEACAKAIEAFAGVAEAIDPDIQFGPFSMKTDWSGFGEGMKGFAEGFNQFAQTIDTSTLSEEMVEKTSYAMKALTDMANNIPRSGGILQTFFGEKNMATFGTQLNVFGTYLMNFFKKITGQDPTIVGAPTLDGEVVKKAANAGKALSDFANSIPNSGGKLQTWLGMKDLASFGTQLNLFATGLMGFFSVITAEDAPKIDVTTAQAAADVGSAIAGLMEELPATGGNWQTFVGSVNLTTFGNDLLNFGIGMASFFRSMKGVGVTIGDVNVAKYAGQAFAGLIEALDPNDGTPFWDSTVDLAAYGEDLGFFGSGIAAFYEAIKAVSFFQVNNAIASIKEIVGLSESLKTIDSSGGRNFRLYLSSLAEVSLTDFSDEFANGVEDLANAVADTLEEALESASGKLTPSDIDFSGIISVIVDTIWLGKERIEASGRLMTYWIKAAFESQYEFIKSAGGYLVTSISDGVKGKLEDLKSAFEEVCGTILDTVNEQFNIVNKSSGKFEEIGEYCIAGFIKGFKDEATNSLPEVRAVGDAIVYATEQATGVNSPSVRFAEIGRYCMLGLSKGLDEYGGGAIKSAVKMGAKLVQAMKDFLQIKSPSKVTRDEIGRYIVEGIAEGIEKNTSAEDAAAQKAQNIVSAFQKEFDKLDEVLNTKNLEYELWQSMNPNASLGESNVKQVQLLDEQMKIQAERVNAANAQYQTTLKSLGQNAEQTSEAYNTYLQEKINLADMANQMTELQRNNTDAFGEFAKIYASNMEGLQRFGFSQEEIREFSKQQSGWVEPSAFTKTGSIEDIMNQYLAETSAGSENVEVVIKQSVQRAVTSAKTTARKGGEETTKSFLDGLEEASEEGFGPDTFKKRLDKYLPSKEDAVKSGENVIFGIEEGINNANEGLIGLGGSLANGASGLLDALNGYLGEHSPSIYTKESGINLIIGLQNGILDPMANSQLMDSIGQVSSNTVRSMRETPEQFNTIGVQMMEGLAKGIRDGKSTAIDAAVEVAVAALQAAQAALGIHSPSKKFYEIGKMIDQGLSNGIMDDYGIVDKSISKLVNRVTQSEDDFVVKMVVDDSDLKDWEDERPDRYTLWWTGNDLSTAQLSPEGYSSARAIGSRKGKWLTVDPDTFNSIQRLYEHGSSSDSMWHVRNDITAGERRALEKIFNDAASETLGDFSLTQKQMDSNYGRGLYSRGAFVNVTQNITSPNPANPAEIARQTGNVLGQLSNAASNTIHSGNTSKNP